MARRKVNYKEGDWIAVPLRDKGYAIGKIARVGKLGALFGYFFGKRFDQIPEKETVEYLSPYDAVFSARFGDLGLRNNEWTIIGSPQSWKRDEWPFPDFFSLDVITGKGRRFRYNEDDLESLVSITPCSTDLALVLPKEGLYGHGAVEIELTRALSQSTEL